MTTSNKKKFLNNNNKSENSLVESIKFLTDLTRKDIERSYNIDNANNTEIYYSNRYGWSVRKAFD